MAATDMKDKIKNKFALKDGFSTSNPNDTAKQSAAQPVTQQHSNTESQTDATQPDQQWAQPQVNARSPYPRKMTLYVTEELFKAFGDIYATRLLRGRKTEKSALICEAIKLLYEKERSEGHI